MDPLSNLAFTTSGALIELVDKKVLVHLRDGRHLIGVLRSYDQYANLVLTQTFERLHHVKSSTFGQMDRGVFLIRGENVVLLGEIDLDKEDPPLAPLTQVSFASISKLLETEKKETKRILGRKEEILFGRHGFGEEGGEGDAY